jgi:hypothetical protein
MPKIKIPKTDPVIESNVINLNATFRKLDTAPPFRNAIWTYEGVDYLVTLLEPGEVETEYEVLVLGFHKSPTPVPLPQKKLALVPLGSPVTVGVNALWPIEAPFAVLNLQQYAAHNAMLFTLANELTSAAQWMLLMQTDMPKVFEDKSGGPRTA